MCSAHGFDHTWEALEAVNGWLVPAQTTTVFPSQFPDGEADTVKIEPLLAKWYKRQKKQALNGTSRLTTEQQHSLSGKDQYSLGPMTCSMYVCIHMFARFHGMYTFNGLVAFLFQSKTPQTDMFGCLCTHTVLGDGSTNRAYAPASNCI